MITQDQSFFDRDDNSNRNMFAKCFLIVLWATAFAQGKDPELDELTILRDEGNAKLGEISKIINNTPIMFENMTKERLDCLYYEHDVQTGATNKSITEAVFKGMLKNKQLVNFQCVSNNSRETFEKLDAIRSQIPENVRKIKEKVQLGVTPFRFVVPGLFQYLEDLYKNKVEELKKEEKEKERQKIVKEFADKAKLWKSILDKFADHANAVKFRFFEEFVNYAFKTDNNLKDVKRDGAKNILKCVS